MKNFTRYTALLMLTLFIGSCEDADKYPIPDFSKGSIPVFIQKDDDTGFVNFMDFNATNLAFDVDRRGTEDVASVDVIVTFNNRETGASESINLNTVTSFPQEVRLTFDELIGLFPPEVVTADTLSLGDSFVVGGYVLLTDGRYLNGGYSPSVVANDPVFLTYNVACASALAGTYDLTLISGTNGEASSLPGETITQLSPGYYELSDMTMQIFGFPIRYRFTDICGELTADAASVDYGTQVTLQFNSGTMIDPNTGEITFDIEYIAPSCCGLEGIQTVFKATPK